MIKGDQNEEDGWCCSAQGFKKACHTQAGPSTTQARTHWGPFTF